MRPGNFITVYGWMPDCLQLKPNEVYVYGCVYGMAKSQHECFDGGPEFLCRYLASFMSRSTFYRCFNTLRSNGLITVNGKKIHAVLPREVHNLICDFYTGHESEQNVWRPELQKVIAKAERVRLGFDEWEDTPLDERFIA